jgi:hypothetical protein
MPRAIPESVERVVRPFLPLVAKKSAELGRTPRDYFLLIGKYEPSKSALVPRSTTADFMALAKSDARRRKYERFLALPCAPNDLLVMVCAGDHVEGYRVRVPIVVPEETPEPSDENVLPVSEATARLFLERAQEWLALGYESVRELGETPGDYLNYVQWPPADGKVVSPSVFPRSKVSDELRHLHGTKKYAQLLEHLEAPCDDVMLVLDVVGREDICVWFRDKRVIPPFELGKLDVRRVEDAP